MTARSTEMNARFLLPGPDIVRALLFAVAVFIGPALLSWHLHGRWNPDGAYSYGWVVLPLAVFLFTCRWNDRPQPSAPVAGGELWAVFFAMMTLPVRWLQEAAPERSVCAWSYAAATIGISLSLIARVGGSAWIRWFSFPFAFLLTAVPWPHTLELVVSNSLMRGTAAATVEILSLAGIPSIQSGNLVHIETGVIDIDEACSGIRSLQAMVMISLFLGELFRLKPTRRLALIALGLAVTLLANVTRTVTLSMIGFSQGIAAVDRYHDPAGLGLLVVSLSITMFAAYRLRSRESMAIAGPQKISWPWKLSFGLLIWFLAGEFSVEAWYRIHEPKWHGWSWAVQWPQREAFHFVEIPQRTLRILMCDESQAGSWKQTDGSDWSGYWIRWNPGNPAVESAKVHRPDVCLNAEGAVMEKDLGTHMSFAGNVRFPFHDYTFRMGEKTLYVFFCLYEEMPNRSTIADHPEFEAVGMFQRALEGRRRTGMQSLELAVSGYLSEASAEEAFKALLGKLIQTNQPAIELTK